MFLTYGSSLWDEVDHKNTAVLLDTAIYNSQQTRASEFLNVIKHENCNKDSEKNCLLCQLTTGCSGNNDQLDLGPWTRGQKTKAPVLEPLLTH